VLVDGTPAAIADDGRFRVRAPAAPGKTSALVSIRDAQRSRDHPDRGLRQQRQHPAIQGHRHRWRKKDP